MQVCKCTESSKDIQAEQKRMDEWKQKRRKKKQQQRMTRKQYEAN